MAQGPNVKKLIVTKMSCDAIPKGGGFEDGLAFLLDPERIKSTAREATEWVNNAILAIRRANEPNPWKTATDEEIAGEILQQIENRKLERLNDWERLND